MPAGDDPQMNVAAVIARLNALENDPQTNRAVIVSRLGTLERDMNDLGATLSDTRERLNYLERDKLSHAEFHEWTVNATAWREEVVKHLERLDGRLGQWAGGSVVLTVIAAAIAAVVGRAP